MAEELWEQIEAGDRCRHGVALGTPGGVDLMCGYCELGLDVWIDDPGYDLVVTLYEQPIKSTGWRQSQIGSVGLAKRVRGSMLRWQEIFEKSGISLRYLVFEVRQSDDGYWASEEDAYEVFNDPPACQHRPAQPDCDECSRVR